MDQTYLVPLQTNKQIKYTTLLISSPSQDVKDFGVPVSEKKKDLSDTKGTDPSL